MAVGLGSVDPHAATAHADLTPVRNATALLDHGAVDLRRAALEVMTAGLRAADPARGVEALIDLDGDQLRIGERSYDLGAVRSVVVLGAGKASFPIAAALERTLGDRLSRGLIVRRSGSYGDLGRLEVLDADHPVPTTASLTAGRRLLDMAAGCGQGDLLITAFTGGSSALACAPPDTVSFEAKQELHSLLLDCGASIEEINAVRKHVSAIKGGRLAALANGACIVNLTVSDVVGDAVDLLCDVAVDDTTRPADAIAVLERYRLWNVVAPSIRDHLGSDAAHSPSLSGADITTHVLVAGSTVVNAMAHCAASLGWTPVILGSSLAGDAASLGRFLGGLARESSLHGRPFAAGSMLIAAGGETTVSIHRDVDGVVGHGGPNQEVTLGFAAANADGRAGVAAAFLDSDGSDGGTDAAGGCVDSTCVARARSLQIDIASALARHDASNALERLGDLVITGPTDTNISDLVVVAIGDPTDSSAEPAAPDSTAP